jgi:hypothetical protein
MATEANGKFLMGTDELTQIDTHLTGHWNMAFTTIFGSNFTEELAPYDIKGKAPNWVAYMERLLEHPAIKPYALNKAANDNFGARAKANDDGGYFALTIIDIAAGFPELA